MSSKKTVTVRPANKNGKDQVKKPAFDALKWFVVIAFIIIGVVSNIYYGQVSGAIRAAVGIVAFIFLLWLFFTTTAGAKALGFIKGAQSEMRKVVWPTRPEAVQMTIIVLIILVVTSLVLWAVDSLFLWLVGLLTGQGG